MLLCYGISMIFSNYSHLGRNKFLKNIFMLKKLFFLFYFLKSFGFWSWKENKIFFEHIYRLRSLSLILIRLVYRFRLKPKWKFVKNAGDIVIRNWIYYFSVCNATKINYFKNDCIILLSLPKWGTTSEIISFWKTLNNLKKVKKNS